MLWGCVVQGEGWVELEEPSLPPPLIIPHTPSPPLTYMRTHQGRAQDFETAFVVRNLFPRESFLSATFELLMWRCENEQVKK